MTTEFPLSGKFPISGMHRGEQIPVLEKKTFS